VVQRIDTATNEVVAEVATPVAPDGLAFDGSIVWAATEIGPQLAGIDPATNQLFATSDIAGHGLIAANQVMAFDADSLWLPILEDDVVLRVRPPAAVVE